MHRRGIIEIFQHKHVFDVDRVSSLIDIDQQHTVDFRIHSGSVAMLAERPKHVPNNISLITQLSAFFNRMLSGRQKRLNDRCPLFNDFLVHWVRLRFLCVQCLPGMHAWPDLATLRECLWTSRSTSATRCFTTT